MYEDEETFYPEYDSQSSCSSLDSQSSCSSLDSSHGHKVGFIERTAKEIIKRKGNDKIDIGVIPLKALEINESNAKQLKKIIYDSVDSCYSHRFYKILMMEDKKISHVSLLEVNKGLLTWSYIDSMFSEKLESILKEVFVSLSSASRESLEYIPKRCHQQKPKTYDCGIILLISLEYLLDDKLPRADLSPEYIKNKLEEYKNINEKLNIGNETINEKESNVNVDIWMHNNNTTNEYMDFQ